MLLPSVEAANAAMRLDPTLVPPIGCVVKSPGGTVGKVTDMFFLGEHSTTSVTILVLIGKVCYETWLPVPVTEIVELPDDCPPLSEWLRVRNVTGGGS